ncbi:MAG: hypothetical protein JEY94_07710 [Melioribacteraceae bacterium]|nr:hypothetical protein [Melioribacteraceae bacterium]
MMLEELKNIKSGKKELRDFGFVIGAVLILISFYQLYKDIDLYVYFLSFGSAFAAFGLALPELLKPLQKVWMTLAILMGFVMTRLILGILFYLVITPMAIIAKVFGKDFLNMKIEKDKSSYWNVRPVKEYKQIDTERQF